MGMGTVSVEIRAGAGTARRESRESGYRRANGASREFSVSRGNSRTKRGEVNWCRVDCFCVADWKARIPPSGNFLNRGEEEWRSDRSVFAFARARYSKTRCVLLCAMFATGGGGEDSTVSLTAIGTPIFFHRAKRGKGSAWRTKWIHRGFRGTRKAIPLPREETRSTVIRLEFCPPRAKRGGKWERGRRAFPLSSRVNSRHRSLFLFEYIYICITVEALLQIFFFLSLSLSLFSLHT